MIIAWKENDHVIGHAIWHESNTEEHRAGSRRDEDDRRLLTILLGQEKKKFVELHEVWLRQEHRDKGYGNRFFEFFENFARSREFDTIVYYADDPAGLEICRKRGYREALVAQSGRRPMFVLRRFL